ncbi:hypothetical protein [Tautonia rosea]|uniref:hypothetical protein n=1 Tax=Tautonia rosea TaxID=2728037 RepID=UPI0014758E77|nr:hypothetical protein [Tautonia rosea]
MRTRRDESRYRGLLERSLAEQWWRARPDKLIRGLWERLNQTQKAEFLAWVWSDSPQPALEPEEAKRAEEDIQRRASQVIWDEAQAARKASPEWQRINVPVERPLSRS